MKKRPIGQARKSQKLMGKYKFEAPIDGLLTQGTPYGDEDNSVSKSQHSM